MPQIPSKSHLIGLISLIIVVLFWLLASILTQDILLQYNKPSLLAFLSVASMQVYFAFLAFEDPLQNYLEAESAYTKVKMEDTLNSSSLLNSALNSVDTKHTDSLETHVNMDMITLKQVKRGYSEIYVFKTCVSTLYPSSFNIHTSLDCSDGCKIVSSLLCRFIFHERIPKIHHSRFLLHPKLNLLLFHFIPRNPRQNRKVNFDQRSGCCSYFCWRPR